MKRKVIVSVTVFVLLAGLVIANAEMRGWHRGFGHRGWSHGPLGYVAKELNLNDTQRQQIRTIWEGEQPALSKLARQLADENRDLSAATAKGTVNEAEASRIAGLQGATLAQMILEKEHLKAKIYTDVLTVDQREKADALLSRWQSHLDQMGKL
jgi:Spy/CpxP family protein refolding chaperone